VTSPDGASRFVKTKSTGKRRSISDSKSNEKRNRIPIPVHLTARVSPLVNGRPFHAHSFFRLSFVASIVLLSISNWLCHGA
jgi:hypothetical protein